MGRRRTRIGVFGPAENATCAAVAAALTRVHATPLVVDTRGPLPISLTLRGITIAGFACERVDGAFVHTIPPRQPLLREVHEGRVASALDVNTWQEGVSRGHAARDLVVAALDALVERGRPVVNPPHGGAYVQRKLTDLVDAAALGLAVPDTLVSADPRALTTFITRAHDDDDTVITKPVRGGAEAHTVEALADITPVRAPVLLQRRVIGTDVRALVLDAKDSDPVLLSVTVAGGRAVDVRATRAYQQGTARLGRCALDDATRAQLVALLRRRGLVFAGVDLIRTKDGRFVFLEMNTAPVFVELAERTGVDVAGALAAYLVGAPFRAA